MFGPTIRLFYFRGIPVEITLFGLILMALIVLPAGGGFTLIVGLALGVVFSILVHEMAHALVGMWLGATVAGIRLDLLGGVTYFSHRPASYVKDIVISMAGPLSNLVLWKVFDLAAGALLGQGQDPVGQAYALAQNFQFGYLFYYLALINLFLGVFNALPCYPLDGGQTIYALVNLITRRDRFAAGLVMVVSWFLAADLVFNFTGILGRIYYPGLFTICVAIYIVTSSLALFNHSTRIINFRPTPRIRAEQQQKESAKRAKSHPGFAVFEQGRGYILNKDYQQAIACFNQAIQLEPKEPTYLDYRAYIYAEIGASVEAEADYTELLRREPQRVEYYTARAQVYLKASKFAEAKADIDRALSLKSSDSEALRLQIELRRRM